MLKNCHATNIANKIVGIYNSSYSDETECDRILENKPFTQETYTPSLKYDFSDISVRDTLNYQNNCRNAFVCLMSNYKVTKLDILIISLVCRW